MGIFRKLIDSEYKELKKRVKISKIAKFMQSARHFGCYGIILTSQHPSRIFKKARNVTSRFIKHQKIFKLPFIHYGFIKTIKKCIKTVIRKVIRIIKGEKDLQYGDYGGWIKYNEPNEVFKEEEVLYKDVTNNIIENAYKVCLKDIDMDLCKILTYIDIYLTIKFGSISKFNKKCFEDKNILNPVRYTLDHKDEFLFIDFDTEVIEIKDIFKQIYDNINDKKISEEDFGLIHKNVIKDIILMSENVSRVNRSIDYQVRKYGHPLYDLYDIYKNLNYKEFMELINSFDFTNNTRTIVTKETE